MEIYYQNNEKYIFDNHRFETQIPENSKWLVIGTFPTLEKNIEFDFYYSSQSNIFWPIIEEIFNHKFKFNLGKEAIAERISFAENEKIGFSDMIQACYRKQYSSQDKQIIPIKLRDIFSILDENVTIDTIVLTSKSGIISAFGLFKSLFLIENKTLEIKKLKNDVWWGEFERGRKIKVLVPYSTSKSYHDNNPEKYITVKKMYEYCFKQHDR